jgi:hypothetical protein
MEPSPSVPSRLVAALAIAGVVWASTSTHAIRDSEKAAFGPLGIADGQILRISAYGVGNPDEQPWTFLFNPQPDPPGEWFATLEVINARTGRTSIMLGGPDTMPGTP